MGRVQHIATLSLGTCLIRSALRVLELARKHAISGVQFSICRENFAFIHTSPKP
jgi:hypothetical protein